MSGEEKGQHEYGLLGLLRVIRMTDPDLNTLALGSDLTTLGLNLNSSKPLYATFASPWADGPATSEPQFALPSCYFMAQAPPLKHAHLQKFQLETLFHIFYAMPKDLLQAYAAAELYHRYVFRPGGSARSARFTS
jgi:CCR4-NOT transcription complex subunit 2